jgi:hypothetical protein
MDVHLKEKHSQKKVIQCAIGIFLLNQALAWVNRNYLGTSHMIESLSQIPRENYEFHAEYFWNVLGYMIFSVYFSLFFSMVSKGKGIIEGLKIGLLVGFFIVGFMFIEWPYLHFEHHDLNIFLAQLIFFLILPGLDGVLATLIYKKN